jgi:antitoxin component YwqK of YwqJK toxin-antitoxin module
MDSDRYANGQPKYELENGVMTHFYKDGDIRATGPFTDGAMEGEWKFYRDSGELWQVGSFKSNVKHGPFVRYRRDGSVEYDATFDNGKPLNRP